MTGIYFSVHVVLSPVYYLSYREYKEALRQQRAHDSVYRPRMSGEGSQQTTPVNELSKQDRSPGNSYSHQPQTLMNLTNHVSGEPYNIYLMKYCNCCSK
jgi:gentisate 1,2-dioxygenase